jgi:hypothetical protein
MADAKFSFQEKGRVYYPAWMSPEGKEKIGEAGSVWNVEIKAIPSISSCL